MSTICNGPKVKYCRSACCYILKKPLELGEVEKVGLENVVSKNGEYFLRNKETDGQQGLGVCVFLDEEARMCIIPLRMPMWCQLYTCAGHREMNNFWQEVYFDRKKRGIKNL
ncbi:hypothetical protein COV17_01315 [Candidatus Woesearchaeota archaeon CG10_big_fil_rev_8_21_14_0_10_36_11]|nr:MAG: hypothetical protein COV17_01315 [Candidatus Woesearchaeota archaeon CG10_big_fil_rev_8_21_14_0_10_36_11]